MRFCLNVSATRACNLLPRTTVNLPLAPIVGVGFMEEIRTIISDAIRTAFVDYPTRSDGSQWDSSGAPRYSQEPIRFAGYD